MPSSRAIREAVLAGDTTYTAADLATAEAEERFAELKAEAERRRVAEAHAASPAEVQRRQQIAAQERRREQGIRRQQANDRASKLRGLESWARRQVSESDHAAGAELGDLRSLCAAADAGDLEAAAQFDQRVQKIANTQTMR